MLGETLARVARKAIGKSVDQAIAAGLARLAEAVRGGGGQPLDIVLPDGGRVSFGLAPRVVLTVKDFDVLAALAQPTLDSLGTAFVEGKIDIDGDMMEVIAVADSLATVNGAPTTLRTAAARHVHTVRQDRVDIQYHYNVGNDFYRLWLDRQMVYSCAYFKRGDESIELAQSDKLDHICRKLRLVAGERLLDIGCGWGALIAHAARYYGVRATGITLSEEQATLAQERIERDGLADRAEVLLLDYREAPARFGDASFDKVSSIGMFEHVGLRNLAEYFSTAARVLRDRGLMLNHGITSSDVESRPVGSGAGEFIHRYVFPHGELPHLHVAVREMSASGFEVVDVENLRRHYALTCSHWSRALESRLADARQAVSEKTLRIWRAYLAGCAHGFAQGWMNLHQVLGVKMSSPGANGMPLTRQWLYPAS